MILLYQIYESEHGTLGQLEIDGVRQFYTLQPDSRDQDRYHIPAGLYRCHRFHGIKWPDTFEIIVPNHTALLFHPGNIEDDTKGCILLGDSTGYLDGKLAILGSRRAFALFMNKFKNQDSFDMQIINEMEVQGYVQC